MKLKGFKFHAQPQTGAYLIFLLAWLNDRNVNTFFLLKVEKPTLKQTKVDSFFIKGRLSVMACQPPGLTSDFRLIDI